MSEIKIILSEIDSDLGHINKIEELYQNIDYVSKVVRNFKGIKFKGQSFSQEYLNQRIKHLLKIVEINVPMKYKKCS